MDDKQAMHAMSIDDAYHVERTLARGPSGVTELVSIDGNGPFVRKKIPSPLAQRNVWAALSACQSNRLPRVEATYELPDRFVIVYDYVPGSTLAQIAEENGRLAPNVAVQLIDQICEAVQELHQHGVIHRDITPANVIVAQDGAHLIDFGIARIRSEASNRSRDTTALGTYGFASPEQYGFAKTDARSDVFSLGRLLGFMLTGVYPDASDYEQRLADDAAVPARLRAVIGYACAFEPSKRPQSIQEFRQALFSQSNPPIPNASSANPPSTRTTNGSASASRLFRRLHLSKRAIVLWSIAGAALIIAAIAGGIVLAGQLGIIGSATSPDSSTQSSSQSTDKADGGHSSNGSGTDNVNGTGGVVGTDGADAFGNVFPDFECHERYRTAARPYQYQGVERRYIAAGRAGIRTAPGPLRAVVGYAGQSGISPAGRCNAEVCRSGDFGQYQLRSVAVPFRKSAHDAIAEGHSAGLQAGNQNPLLPEYP